MKWDNVGVIVFWEWISKINLFYFKILAKKLGFLPPTSFFTYVSQAVCQGQFRRRSFICLGSTTCNHHPPRCSTLHEILCRGRGWRSWSLLSARLHHHQCQPRKVCATCRPLHPAGPLFLKFWGPAELTMRARYFQTTPCLYLIHCRTATPPPLRKLLGRLLATPRPSWQRDLRWDKLSEEDRDGSIGSIDPREVEVLAVFRVNLTFLWTVSIISLVIIYLIIWNIRTYCAICRGS